MSQNTGAILVVVSHYDARPSGSLIELLKSMRSIPAAWPFDVRVVVNQGTAGPLRLPPEVRTVEVIYRENVGYNIGAWDFGWRLPPVYDGYLFLQDECRIVREGWLGAFVHKAAEPGVGLLGECLSRNWDAPWEVLRQRTRYDRLREHLVDGMPAERVDCYLDFFRRHGIPPGGRGNHLQSLVWFARRRVLEAIDGFPLGRNFGEAIAAEIGTSKKVQAMGLAIAEVGPGPFCYIEHPQWLHRKYERACGGEQAQVLFRSAGS